MDPKKGNTAKTEYRSSFVSLVRTSETTYFKATFGKMFSNSSSRTGSPKPKRGWLQLCSHQMNWAPFAFPEVAHLPTGTMPVVPLYKAVGMGLLKFQ